MAQDRHGFMWFGTKDGLNRFDGYQFDVFVHDPADSTSISGNSISVLLTDGNGRMWVGAAGVLHLYNDQRETFVRIPLPGHPAINAATHDLHGSIWLATNRGVIRVTPATTTGDRLPSAFTVESFTGDAIHPLVAEGVSGILVDRKETLWICSGANVFSRDARSPQSAFRRHRFLAPEGQPVPGVLSLFEDSRGQLWAGTFAGLYRYGESRDAFEHQPGPRGRPLTIRTIAEDLDGLLWIGTFWETLLFNPASKTYSEPPGNLRMRAGPICIRRERSGGMWIGGNGEGLYFYSPRITHFESYTEATAGDIGWKGHSVRSIFEDADRRVWIGSYGGLFTLNAARTEFRSVPVPLAPPVKAILRDRTGTLWIGADAGLARLNPRTHRFESFPFPRFEPRSPLPHVRGLLEDRDGVLWAVSLGRLNRLERGTERWTSYAFESSTSFNDPPPASICQTPDGRLWITSATGLWAFDPDTESFHRYGHTPGVGTSLSHDFTLSLCPDPADPDRYLWVGTAGGLNRLDLSRGTFDRYTESDGLPNNVLYGVLSDDAGSLWLSTNKGLARFDPVTKTVVRFSREDGLQNAEYNTGAYFRGPDGDLLFGGIMGFDAFEPVRSSLHPFEPPVVVTSFSLFNRLVKPGDSTGVLQRPVFDTKDITLTYGQNSIAFTFAALDYASPRRNRYEYQLIGFDQQPVSAGSQRTAGYTNLDPGEYTLVVRGTNSQGDWSPHQAALHIEILPPFWMTWWFRMLLGAAFFSIGPLIYVRRVSALKKERTQQQEFSRGLIDGQEAERKRIAGEIHDGFGQNILVMKNRALLALEKTELPPAVVEDLTEISSTASTTLKEMREMSRNLRPYELDRFGLTEALKSVVERMEGSSALTIHPDLDMIDGLFPREGEINVYRIVQECLNNVVKHSKASEAWIHAKANAGVVTIVVRDNGSGMEAEGGKNGGLGLSGIRERVRMLGGNLKIQSSPGQGTTVEVTIPEVNGVRGGKSDEIEGA